VRVEYSRRISDFVVERVGSPTLANEQNIRMALSYEKRRPRNVSVTTALMARVVEWNRLSGPAQQFSTLKPLLRAAVPAP